MGKAHTSTCRRDFYVRTDVDSGHTVIARWRTSPRDHCRSYDARLRGRGDVGTPRLIYRETTRADAEAERKYIRQTGGSVNCRHANVRITSNEPRAMSSPATPASVRCRRSTSSPSARGAGRHLAGNQMVNIKVSLHDVSYHDVNSNGMAFKEAAKPVPEKRRIRQLAQVLQSTHSRLVTNSHLTHRRVFDPG
jgi:elongation factor G